MSIVENEGQPLQNRAYRQHLDKNWNAINQYEKNVNAQIKQVLNNPPASNADEVTQLRIDVDGVEYPLVKPRIDTLERKLKNKADLNYIKNYLSSISYAPEVVANLAELYSKYEDGKPGLIITADTDHKYYWENGKWNDKGVYGTKPIGEKAIKEKMLDDEVVGFDQIGSKKVKNKKSLNLLDLNKLIAGAVTVDGILESDKWWHTEAIKVNTGDSISFNRAYSTYAVGFDVNGNPVKNYLLNGGKPELIKIIIEGDVSLIIINVYEEFKSEAMLTINSEVPIEYEPYNPYPNEATLNWLKIPDKSVKPENLAGIEIINQQSTNRFNLNKVIVGEAATVSGFIKSDNWARTDYIEVNTGDVININYANQTYAVAYDAAKRPIADFFVKEIKSNVTISIEADYSYVILNIPKVKINTFMFTRNKMMPAKFEEYVEHSRVRIPWIVNDYNNKWTNKNAQIFGDSIVWYDGHPQPDGTTAIGYPTLLKESLGFNEVANLGISGAPIARGKTPDNGIGNCIGNKYKPCDLVIIEGGTNDFKLDVELGVIDKVGAAFDKTTTTGALQAAVESIFKSNPDQLIALMTPLQRNNGGYDIYNQNAAGYTLDDYRKSIINVGKLYSIPVWDGYAQSGVNMLNLITLTLDGLHLNNRGYSFVTKKLIKFIN